MAVVESSDGLLRSGGGLDEAELRKRRDAVVETDLRDDFSASNLKDGRPGEAHLATGGGRQRSDEEIAERRAGVRPAALPPADHVIASAIRSAAPQKCRSGKALRKS